VYLKGLGCGQERSRRRWRESLSLANSRVITARVVFKFYQQTGAVSKENQTSTYAYISKLGRLKVSAQIKPGSKSISVYFCSRGKAAQRKLLWTCLATFNGHGKVDIRKIAKKGGARTRSSWTVPAGQQRYLQCK